MAYYGNEPADVALKVGSGVITATEIQDASIITADISNDAITPNQLDDDATGFEVGSLGIGAAVSGSNLLHVAGPGNFTGAVTATLGTASQPNVTTMTGLVTTGTIGTGVWQGTPIASAYVATLNQNTTGTAATVTGGTQASITSTANLVTVGTITTGVWNAGAVTSSGAITAGGDFHVPTTSNIGWGSGAERLYGHTGSNYIRIDTNSAERMRIDSAGKVGIGTGANVATVSGATDLTIGNTTGAHGITIISQSNTVGNIFFAEAVGTVTGKIEYSNDIQDMFFTAGSSRRMTINSTGVGIGTESPAAKLHIDGNAFIDEASTLATNDPPTTLYINAQADPTLGFGIRGDGSAASFIMGIDDSDSDKFKITCHGTDVGGHDHFIIDGGGKVGIGTASPTAPLTIEGDATYGDSSTYMQLDIQGATSSAKHLKIGYDTTANAGVIYPCTTNVSHDNLLLCPVGGNVGIGVTVPSAALTFSSSKKIKWHINAAQGDSRSWQINNDQQAWGDFQIMSSDGQDNTIDTYRLGITKDGHAKFFSDGDEALHCTGGSSNGSATQFRVYSAVGGVGTNIFAINGNGDVLSATNSYGNLSDRNLKTNIVDANSQWDDIKALRIRNYELKEYVETGIEKTMIGVIAQEVEESGMTGLVDEFDRTGDGEMVKTVKNSIIYMKAIKALQEAMEKIETLETKVTALENA